MTAALLLASSSSARRELLARLGLPFVSASPDIDERSAENENIQDYVQRLSLAKARALAASHPQRFIIGSDQACTLDGHIIGKPGNHEAARSQLAAASGNRVDFYTGLALLDSHTDTAQVCVERFSVHFRKLNALEIDTYLYREEPYLCAGSFKAEGLGISLFESLEGRDFTALIGLPLIALCTFLRQVGINPLIDADA